jgi:uncharacterized integral membrane protein (TIGR00697 family)
MPNEGLWLVMLLVNFGCIALSYRFFGRVGLYAWIPLSVILANVQVLKTVELFGLVCTLGNILYAGSFLVTDILSENYGKKAAATGVLIGFFSLIAMTLLMQLAVFFTPHASDFSQSAMETLFGLMPRIAGASLLAYLISQAHDVWAYDFWRRRFPAFRWIWLRNNASTMVSQFLDTLIFTLAAFWGVFPKEILIEIFLTTYFLKWLVAAMDTPFLYLAGRQYQNGRVREA